MNILYSVFAEGWGGLEKYPLTLIEPLKKQGHKIYILTVENTNLHKECLKRKINVFTVKKIKKLDIKTINLMKKIVSEKEIDVVHSNTSREVYNWRFALIGQFSVKYFLTFHIGIPNHNEFIHKFLYKKVDKIIAICNYEKEKMKKNLPVPDKKLQLLYNGVKLENFNRKKVKNINFRNKYKIDKSAIFFLAVGNLSRGKGILEFIEASKKILDEYKNVVFGWIGSDAHIEENYSLDSLRRDIEKDGYSQNLKLFGYQNDIPSILAESDVFVLPSHQESFGIVYIEAMAMELPVIACRSGGVPEIVLDNENGYLVEPKDFSDLAVKFEKAIKNIENLKITGKNNRNRAEKFSMEAHINNLLEIYNS